MNAFKLNELRSAGAYRSVNFSRRYNSINEAKAARVRTIFLSHSHKDRDYALGLKAIIEDGGGSLYIDWLDEAMPEVTSKETAQRIRSKIVDCDLFLFLATPNSMASRWCPWEIGYADGKKPIDNIVIVPTTEDGVRYYGSEYLQLYRRLEPSALRSGSPSAVKPGEYSGTPINRL